MALDSSSSFADVQAAYDDNAPPFRSISQCESFIQACSILIRRMPEQSGNRESNLQFRMDLIEKQQKDAKEWLSANSPTGSTLTSTTSSPRVVRVDLRNSRY